MRRWMARSKNRLNSRSFISLLSTLQKIPDRKVWVSLRIKMAYSDGGKSLLDLPPLLPSTLHIQWESPC